MRLSTKGRYAVMAMVDLARRGVAVGEERSVCLAEIAQRQEISLAYLEQIFARLRRRGLVTSARGPRQPVAAVDEPLKVTEGRRAARLEAAA